ncbi:MAG: hypothetical protein MI743_01555 [Sneathiellales bacterium]|nr:hypothetical protein [Sneathiellales bacterium]
MLNLFIANSRLYSRHKYCDMPLALILEYAAKQEIGMGESFLLAGVPC